MEKKGGSGKEAKAESNDRATEHQRAVEGQRAMERQACRPGAWSPSPWTPQQPHPHHTSAAAWPSLQS